MGAFAQYYSDNLSQETKKGWHERRAQGLYCGLLPFGAMKGEDGVPVPNSDAHPGLAMSFELAAQGKSDREVAMALNEKGYRTAGNQGNRPFSRDIIRGMFTNKFYLGYLLDGNGGWMKGKHEAFIDGQLWNQAQEMRRRNATSTYTRCRSERKVCSLSGITYCWYCKGRIHVSFTKKGKRRLGCYNRSKGWDCSQKSALLEVYEEQIEEYLKTLHIPENYQEKILEAHHKLEATYEDMGEEKTRLKARLERLKDLYKWGDIAKEEYLKEREGIQRQLKTFTSTGSRASTLGKLAEFLSSVVKAWKEANQEQRNKLARTLFQEIWIKDKQVVAVKPQPEFEPFFQLNYGEFVNKSLKKRPRGDSNP